MPSLKASQWSFTIPSFNSTTIDRLSSLLSDDLVLYVTFAVCEDGEDDTGNIYIQGLIKTSHRCRVGPLRRLTGPALFSTVTRPSEILMNIQMKSSFQEFGKSPFEYHSREIASLKHTIDHGTYSIDYLMATYPYVCTRHIGLVLKYIHEVLSTKSETPEVQPERISLCA
jgi:hypothetical protein